MKTENNKINNHRYSIDLPEKVFTALKIKSALEKKSVKDIILSSLEGFLGDNFANSNNNEQKEILSFTGLSNKAFSKEWNSEEDEEAFSNLQKYKRS